MSPFLKVRVVNNMVRLQVNMRHPSEKGTDMEFKPIYGRMDPVIWGQCALLIKEAAHSKETSSTTVVNHTLTGPEGDKKKVPQSKITIGRNDNGEVFLKLEDCTQENRPSANFIFRTAWMYDIFDTATGEALTPANLSGRVALSWVNRVDAMVSNVLVSHYVPEEQIKAMRDKYKKELLDRKSTTNVDGAPTQENITF